MARTRFHARCRFSLASAAISSADPVPFGSCRGRRASSLPEPHAASPRPTPAARSRRHLTRCSPHRHGVEHSLSFGPSPTAASQPPHRLLRPLLTSRSGSTPSPFQARGEISPGKNALLHCTTAGSTPLPLDHESFAVFGPLALVGNAFYPVLVHRLAASLHASSPHSVTLMQLRFTSLAVINSRWDFHPQECAHAGRTIGIGGASRLLPSHTTGHTGPYPAVRQIMRCDVPRRKQGRLN